LRLRCSGNEIETLQRSFIAQTSLDSRFFLLALFLKASRYGRVAAKHIEIFTRHI